MELDIYSEAIPEKHDHIRSVKWREKLKESLVIVLKSSEIQQYFSDFPASEVIYFSNSDIREKMTVQPFSFDGNFQWQEREIAHILLKRWRDKKEKTEWEVRIRDHIWFLLHFLDFWEGFEKHYKHVEWKNLLRLLDAIHGGSGVIWKDGIIIFRNGDYIDREGELHIVKKKKGRPPFTIPEEE